MASFTFPMVARRWVAPRPGLHIGIRTHFDLGAVWKTGRGYGCGHLPVYDGLVFGEDIANLGGWDGTQGLFTDNGWGLNPLLGMRETRDRRRMGGLILHPNE